MIKIIWITVGIIFSTIICDVKADKPPPPGTLLGEECSENSTCSVNVTHSYCKTVYDKIGNSYGFCDCDHGYTPSRDLDRCLFANIVIGDQCDEDQQCVGYKEDRSSACLPGSGICDCRPGYVQSKNLRECLPIVQRLGTVECKESSQCELGKPGKHSQCVGIKKGNSVDEEKKVCRCNNDAVDGADGKNKNNCLKKAKKFGDSCKIQAQCTASLKYAICLHGKCRKI